MRRRIYIAGPISRGDLRTNIQQADDAAGRLIAAGFAPVVPHWSCYYDRISGQVSFANDSGGIDIVPLASASATNAVPYETWMEIGLSLLSTCHALLRLPGESPGADREVEFARERSIAVFTDIDEAIAYLSQFDDAAREKWRAEIERAAKRTDWSQIIGQWPGDETDEQIDAAMRKG